MRRKARTDSNHAEIRDAIRKAGCSVRDTSQLGSGFPDLVVRVPSRDPRTLLVEVKAPGGKLTDDQRDFIAEFPETAIVESVEEALRLVFQIRRTT